jgi:hypothetical protein
MITVRRGGARAVENRFRAKPIALEHRIQSGWKSFEFGRK